MSSVSFTGHRALNFAEARQPLRLVLKELIDNGADTFYAGGARGFDMLAAQTVLSFKVSMPYLRLIMVLPCPEEEQTRTFSPHQRSLYYRIISRADDVELISDHYTKSCMRERNQRLIDHADICVCYYDENRHATGTGQTVRMAEKKGIRVINIYGKE